MSRVRKLFILGVVLVASGCIFWSSRTWQFQGDGRLTYLGPFRPSYELKLSAIPISKPGVYQYKFRGFPSEDDVNFSLNVDGATREQRPELDKLEIRIEASLTGQGNGEVCRAWGVPGGAPWAADQTGKWMLETGPNDASYWHPNCSHFRTKRKEPYTLVVKIADVDAKALPRLLISTIEGGGSELP